MSEIEQESVQLTRPLAALLKRGTVPSTVGAERVLGIITDCDALVSALRSEGAGTEDYNAASHISYAVAQLRAALGHLVGR